jgi:hypothetical protein
MPIATSCPNCRTKYTLADNQLDKTVLCRGCQRPFLVSEDVPAGQTFKRPGSSGERPRLREDDRRRDDYDRDRDRDRDRDYRDRDRDRDRDYRDRPHSADPHDLRDRPRRRREGGIPVVVWLMIAGGATIVVIVGTVVALIAFGAFGGGTVTMANYQKLRTGMTEAEVVAIMGKPHEVQTDSAGGFGGMNLQVRVLGWKSGRNRINVGLFNNKVVTKAAEINGMKVSESGLSSGL